MSHADENRFFGPVFEQPDGVGPRAEERTQPLVDLYPPSAVGGNAAPSSMGNPYLQPGYPPGPQHQPGGWGGPGLYGPAGQPQQPRPYGVAPQWAPEHPQATTVLVLALVSLALPILSFVAWYMGSKAKSEIDAGAPYAYGGNLHVGHIIGKVIGIITIVGAAFSIVFLVLYFVALVGMFAFIG